MLKKAPNIHFITDLSECMLLKVLVSWSFYNTYIYFIGYHDSTQILFIYYTYIVIFPKPNKKQL